MIWNVSLRDEDLLVEELKMKKKYECARTSFKFMDKSPQLIKEQYVTMKDTDEEVTGEYQIPEMESTVPGCAVFYKAFL
jgi:hypothetical protein